MSLSACQPSAPIRYTAMHRLYFPYTRRWSFHALALCLSVMMFFLTACSSPEEAPTASADDATHYDMKAIVVGAEEGTNKVQMDHEEIPGLMGAMRMSFAVPNDTDREKMKPGARIKAKLVMENNTLWVEGVEVLGHGEVPPAEEKPAAGHHAH